MLNSLPVQVIYSGLLSYFGPTALRRCPEQCLNVTGLPVKHGRTLSFNSYLTFFPVLIIYVQCSCASLDDSRQMFTK